MSDALFDVAAVPAAAGTAGQRAQWRLSTLEVLNWGTFSGHHIITVPASGLVFTGDSGSGKSSLLDAMSTVLTPRARLRYNAAAQDHGARGTDRSLVSYIRGAYGAAEAEDVDEIRTTYLRTGATFAGVLLRYEKPAAEPVTLIKLFKLNAGQMNSSDVKEICLLVRARPSLTDYLDYVRTSVELRRLKKDHPDAYITDRHRMFQTRYRKALGIASDAAMLLLHRTVAAKNLGSLDDLFRDYMLTEPTTFETADRAVEQFDQLSEAHESVVTARRQLDALDVICRFAADYDTAAAQIARTDELLAGLDPVAAALTLELAERERAEVRRKLSTAEAGLAQAQATAAEAVADVDAARAVVQQAGGAEIARLEDRLSAARTRLTATTRRRKSLAGRLERAGIGQLPASREEYDELLAAHAETDAAAAPSAAPGGAGAGSHAAGERAEQRAMVEAGEARGQARRELAALQEDLQAARTQQSNLDRPLLAARQRIAEALGIGHSALPFGGELMEVREDEQDWRGAIERLLSPLSRTMLVDARHAAAVAAVLDAHHFGTRVVVQAIGAESPAPASAADERSVVHKVAVREDSAFAHWIHHTLSARYDFACVDAPGQLTEVRQGLTRAGQVKRPGQRYEKDDRTRVDDRRRWVMGFSAVDKIAELMAAVGAAEKALAAAEERYRAASAAHDAERSRQALLTQLAETPWEELDAQAIETEIAAAEQRLDRLISGDADLAAARASLAALTEALAAARDAEDEARALATELREDLRRVGEAHRRARAQTAEFTAAPAAVDEELRSRFRAFKRRLSVADIAEAKNRIERGLNAQRETQRTDLTTAQSGFERRAQHFRHTWPAFAADATAEIADREAYRQEMLSLRSDGLPEHEGRFFEMLRKQSTNNIGRLNTEISRAFGEISERIDQVNRSLAGSQFDRGRYLRIKPKERRSSEVHAFLADLREITAGALTQLSEAEAERKFALMQRVIGRLGSPETADRRWRAACLDTRRHVSFLGVERNAAGEQVRVYESSTGLSGGQRQKLVVFCLAAALRYQLTDSAEELPEYSTVMLDEAFDKADESFARMALETFVAFGFQLVLATPKKLLPILEDYVGAAVTISISEGRDSRLAELRWEDA